MIPVFGTILDGLKVLPGFLRTYRWQAVGFPLVYLVMAGVGATGRMQLPLPPWVGSQLSTWLLSVLGMIVLAPVWASLFRYAILKDTSRSWRQIDRRTWRVGVIMLALSLISLIGAAPFALGLDVLPRIGPRRAVALMAMGTAVVVKLGAIWLGARLAIAPAMAATGTRPQALDVSFGYTRHATWRMIAIRLVIYLPLLCVTGGLEVLGRSLPVVNSAGPGLVFAIVGAVVSALLTAATELVEGATMGRAAPALVKAQRVRAEEKARKAKLGIDDDD